MASANDTSILNIQIAPGRYDVTVTGTSSSIPRTESFTVTVNGETENHYSYSYKLREYGADWTVDYSYIDSYYTYRTSKRHPNYNNMDDFVEYDCDTVVQLASVLTEQSEGMSKNEQSNFVLNFVQKTMSYELDERYNGKTEYWKYPVETLFDRRGDCEDTSVLYCAIMKAMGYDVALLIFDGEEYTGKGHAAAGIVLDNVPGGTYYEKNGKHYYYCETTAEGWHVGDIPKEYGSCKVITVS